MKKKIYSDQELVERRLAGILPRIDIAGHEFIIDWRLKELRAEDDVSTRINLRDMPMDRDGLHYLCFYHLPSRSVVHVNDQLTELPADTVLLEIPYELKLDPVATAREYGLKDTELLSKFPILPNLTAKVKPLEETGLPELVQQNRKKLLAGKKKNKGKRI